MRRIAVQTRRNYAPFEEGGNFLHDLNNVRALTDGKRVAVGKYFSIQRDAYANGPTAMYWPE